MTAASSWQPILNDEAAARAVRAIAAIAGDLLEMPPRAPKPGQRISPPFSLAEGDAGQALLFAYLDLAHPGQGWEEAALARLHRAIEAAGAIQTFPGLYSGFTGVAWVVEHFQSPELGTEAGNPGGGEESTGEDSAGEDSAEDHDPGAEIAAALAQYLEQPPNPEEYDLISGLVGVGAWALERWPRPFARECLERVAERLAETAEERPEGLTWLTPPELVPERERAQHPRGYHNLGVAHGVPGVIALLAGMYAAGVAGGSARRLLDGAVSWLLAQNQGPQALSCFGYYAGSESASTTTRLTWCYGDPGVAAALFAAARAVGHAGWEREALAIGRAAARRTLRPEERARVPDTGLCHGAAGVGHLFNRLYQASGEESFQVAARIWFEQALASARPGAGVGGFLALHSDADNQLDWQPDAGFLTGSAGIGLALLAATQPTEPAWDRVLLASLPQRRDLGD
jgi:hypothetical protein